MTDTKFVFCEGGDDEAVIRALAESLALQLSVEPFKGKDNLGDFLASVQKRPQFAQKRVASVAVIRDADRNGAAAFASVRDAFARAGFHPPDTNREIRDGLPRCGILVIPTDGPGMLEDICLRSVEDRPEFPCVSQFFECVAARSTRGPFTSKHKMHVWMGCHSFADFRKATGAAVKAGLFPLDHACFGSIRAFLKML